MFPVDPKVGKKSRLKRVHWKRIEAFIGVHIARLYRIREAGGCELRILGSALKFWIPFPAEINYILMANIGCWGKKSETVLGFCCPLVSTGAVESSTMPTLKKSLGQHHLKDGLSCRPLVDFLKPSGSRVLEVGPGGGVLTQQLVIAGARIQGVELDLPWAFYLGPPPGGSLVIADIMKFPFDRLKPPTLVAGNLPYNVATPLIRRIVNQWERVPRAAFLVQREVAERLAAKPRTKAYGLLSVIVQARAHVRILGILPPHAFRPPPKVESAFVGLTLQPPPRDAITMDRLEKLVSAGFGQRRKTLPNSLGAKFGKAEISELLEVLGVSLKARAEELSLGQWLELADTLPKLDSA